MTEHLCMHTLPDAHPHTTCGHSCALRGTLGIVCCQADAPCCTEPTCCHACAPRGSWGSPAPYCRHRCHCRGPQLPDPVPSMLRDGLEGLPLPPLRRNPGVVAGCRGLLGPSGSSRRCSCPSSSLSAAMDVNRCLPGLTAPEAGQQCLLQWLAAWILPSCMRGWHDSGQHAEGCKGLWQQVTLLMPLILVNWMF